MSCLRTTSMCATHPDVYDRPVGEGHAHSSPASQREVPDGPGKTHLHKRIQHAAIPEALLEEEPCPPVLPFALEQAQIVDVQIIKGDTGIGQADDFGGGRESGHTAKVLWDEEAGEDLHCEAPLVPRGQQHVTRAWSRVEPARTNLRLTRRL